MPRSTSTSGSSICSYYTAPSDYDTTDDYYSNLPVTSTDLRARTDNPGTWPLRSRRTDPRLSERTTRIFVPADSISGEVHIDSEILARGYNPSYYGDIAPIAGSSPALTDVGYRIESPDTPPVGTPMGDRYRQYKSYDVDAYEAEQEYNDRFKEVPKAPRKKHKTEDYKGDPPMTLNHHRRLAPRFVHGEDEAYQEEAKEERIRAKKEKHRRMGYERSAEDD
ncbi:hypothetical protein HO133_003503 [Letharia lupina]|uniref:Uncharacterized protein n=1 Tax=Letharia lupina TaxID=560253 RepID=A0A8H6F9X5_9LECA|nr:uncharacterized protein HO133_003503 [Letharia lupina]KAF6220371.1 hypothetical protein HO133_003503 [Letharia lupina]